MTDSKTYPDSVRSTLFRPPPLNDYVRREDLAALLEDRQAHPIIVVSAPAGYGKSTEVSHWAESTGADCVWISLDSSHNDLGVFLRYFEAGLNDWIPAAAELLRKILGSAELPAANQIADIVASKLDEVTDELIVVFDDYHEIHDASIHLFVESLLNGLPDSLRIAIISRRTAPIALSRLRSRGLVLDVRLQDLRFDRSAMQELVKQQSGLDVDKATMDKLAELTEGWPAGLRMLLLARGADVNLSSYLENLQGQAWQIQEYLVEEVLRQLPPDVASHIGVTAILGRFSSGLCESLIESNENTDISGKQLVELVRNRGLFCIPLDESGEWYRYHNLFRELLLRQLRSRYSEDELRHLHARAARWLDDEGQIEEAVDHYMLAKKFDAAAKVVLGHSDSLIRTHQWRRLDKLLNALPSETVSENLEVLMLLSWSSGRLGRVNQEVELATKVRNTIDKAKSDRTVDGIVNGQSYAQFSVVEYYWGHGEAALAASEKALELLPPSYVFARGEATMMRGVSLQMTGNAAAGLRALLDSFESSGNDSGLMQARILMGCCYLSWTNGDLRELSDYAKTMLDNGRAQDDRHAIIHACWFGGAALYQLNRLDDAEELLSAVIEDKWWPHQASYSYCVEIMSMIHSARGNHIAAAEMLDDLVAQSLESRATSHITYLQSLRARLAFASGDIATASHRALDYEPGPITAGYEFLVPALGVAQIAMQSDSPEVHTKIRIMLEEHQQMYESTNNVRFLIETLALQAIFLAKTGDDDTALQVLKRAVDLAERREFVRVFVDLGPDIAPLLSRLSLDEKQLTYVGKLLAELRGHSDEQQGQQNGKTSTQKYPGLIEALSKREQEVLELLANRLTNKEIGARLSISPETVKRHAHNVFEKLNVSSRREARAKAIGFGLVSE